MYMLAPSELAPTEDQGFVMGIVEAPADATIDQTTFYTEAVNRELLSLPEAAQTFQSTFPDNGFSGLVLKPWGERKRTVFQVVPEVQEKVNRIPGIQTFAATPPALPGGGEFPVEFVIGATAEPETILKYATTLQTNAEASGMFAFPPIIDTKIDQPEFELVMDRDKVAALGLNMATVGADLATLVGGNFVNRFNFDGRSLQGDSPGETRRAAQPESAREHVCEGAERPVGASEHVRHVAEEDGPALPQPLPAVQCRQDQRGGPSARSTRRLVISKQRRGRFCPKATNSTTPGNPGNCASKAADSCRPSSWP